MSPTFPQFLKRAAAIVASLAILSTGLITGLSLVSTSLGSAAVASTTHALPINNTPGVTFPCKPTPGYSCTPGYTGTNATGWAATDYGCPKYPSGCPSTPHNCTLYAAFMLMKNGYGNPGWSGDADEWATKAHDHGVAVDQTPHVGAIAEWNGDHVAYVIASDSGGITLTMDDFDTKNPFPIGYTAEAHITPGSPAWPDNFIHFDDQGGSTPAPSQAPAPQTSSGSTVTIVNASGGVYWRSQTDWNTPVKNPGYGVYNGDRVKLLCWQRGAANTPPYDNNPLWYQAAVISGEGKGQGWVNDHFLDTGLNVPNVPVSGVPSCQSTANPATTPASSAPTMSVTLPNPAGASVLQPAAGATTLQPAAGVTQLQAPTTQPQGPSTGTGGSAPTTQAPSGNGSSSTTPQGSSQPVAVVVPPDYPETVGGVSHTWSDYGDAGGNEGPSIPSNETVQIACKITGFQVADGNTWWYRIASSPWSNAYYVSADAFYNNGATSGSLHGTPFVDNIVPDC